jgi:hypothetical protein
MTDRTNIQQGIAWASGNQRMTSDPRPPCLNLDLT